MLLAYLLHLWPPLRLVRVLCRLLLVRYLLTGVAVAVVDAAAVALLPAVSVLSVIGVREVTMFELVAVVLCRRLLLLRVQLDLLILCVRLDLLPPIRRVVVCVLVALVLLVVDMLVIGARLAVELVPVVMFVCLGGLRPHLTLAPRGLPPALGSVHFVAVVGVVAKLVLMVLPVLELASAM